MTRPVTKWSAQPATAGQIPFYLGRAWSEANTGRRGAVHLNIPVDLFMAEATTVSPEFSIPDTSDVQPDPRQIAKAIALMQSAERPVVIAGSGVWWGDAATELREFVEKTALPLYTITMAKGTVPDNHPLCMGYADPALNTAVHTAFKEADLFVVIGKRIDYRLALGGARLFSTTAKFIQVDIHPQELGQNHKLDAAICSEVKPALRAMSVALPRRTAWLDHLRDLRLQCEQRISDQANDTGSPLHPAAFYAELKKTLPAETLFAWDGGDFAHWGRASIPAMHNGGWLGWVRSGQSAPRSPTDSLSS